MHVHVCSDLLSNATRAAFIVLHAHHVCVHGSLEFLQHSIPRDAVTTSQTECDRLTEPDVWIAGLANQLLRRAYEEKTVFYVHCSGGVCAAERLLEGDARIRTRDRSLSRRRALFRLRSCQPQILSLVRSFAQATSGPGACARCSSDWRTASRATTHSCYSKRCMISQGTSSVAPKVTRREA